MSRRSAACAHDHRQPTHLSARQRQLIARHLARAVNHERRASRHGRGIDGGDVHDGHRREDDGQPRHQGVRGRDELLAGPAAAHRDGARAAPAQRDHRARRGDEQHRLCDGREDPDGDPGGVQRVAVADWYVCISLVRRLMIAGGGGGW